MNTTLLMLGKRVNMARRSHRRWLVVLIYAGFAALVLAWFSNYAPKLAAWCLIGAVAFQLTILHLVGRSSEATDERESHRWDHAHARAYPWIGYCLLVALFTSPLTRTGQASALATPALHGQLPYMLLMTAGILYVSLPQAILLWTEPDILEAE